jgi:hypothetical protein
MQSLFIEYIFLMLIILVLVMLANKLRLAYPIVLHYLEDKFGAGALNNEHLNNL